MVIVIVSDEDMLPGKNRAMCQDYGTWYELYSIKKDLSDHDVLYWRTHLSQSIWMTIDNGTYNLTN